MNYSAVVETSCSIPVESETDNTAVRAIAKELVAQGYEVTFVSGSYYRKLLEDVGCTYVPLEGECDFAVEVDFDRILPNRDQYPNGPLRVAYDLETVFVAPIFGQHQTLQKALAMLMKAHPGRPVVQLCEGFFHGAIPISMGASGIRPTATVGLGIIPMLLTSIDCAPFGPGMAPDSSPEGHIKNKAMAAHRNEVMLGKAQATWSQTMKDLGADTTGYQSFLDAAYLAQDSFLQMCIPSVEYPRSDAPSTIKFAGGLPKGSRDPMTNPPTWWNEVVENKDKKDIIFVCQGTVSKIFTDLNLPTMEALATRENTLVIVALGLKGATVPEGIVVPANTRVIDFLPFDEILPHATVFVTNGGYGAFQHGLVNGTPLLMAGAGEDKPEVSMRAEWAGVAVNLKTGNPTKEAIKIGVEEIISNPKYKTRALELQAETAKFDPISFVMETIEELAREKHVE